ncbi:CoB--CoM heterodisulfide reductase iron-sulfur subunit A family protein, partial [bacterium]|nr:CoB--CoM heterodisulfide reductase iron-sulfur subunit A family protein [bacterium]
VDRVIGFFGNYEITLKSGGEEGAERNLVAGAVVIATGFDFYDPTRMEKWGYTSVDNVVTSEEVVEMMGSDGKLTLKDGKTPKSVALVHCVGREEMGYCSKVCCTNLMEIAQYLKAKVSGIEIHELHRDICVPHEKDQKYYQQTVEQGVNFIRLQEVSKITSSGSQVNIAYKSISGKEEKLSVDMVILAPGIKPAISTPVVAEIINVPLHSTGFFKEAHEKLNPIATPMDGIFAVGCAQGPKNIVESVMQAQAATGKIFASLVPGRKLEPEVKVSEVIEAFCTGCQTCLTVCCYGAISYDENKGISVVNEAICRGCGNCAGSCPSNAIRAKHFTTSELYKEVIEALR